MKRDKAQAGNTCTPHYAHQQLMRADTLLKGYSAGGVCSALIWLR